MRLDHSEAFVRVKFDGLIAFCFRRRDDHSCEMGMVQADDHEPLLNITVIHRNGTRSPHTTNRRLKPEDAITIRATDPVDEGALTFPLDLTGEFDRLTNLPDPEDFRWIMNLQGQDFHGSALRPIQGATGQALLRPKITVTEGICYTLEKTEGQFARITSRDDPRPIPIGKIADAMGVDIRCHAGAQGQKEVVIQIGTDQITLNRNNFAEVGLRYFVEITNLCRSPGAGGKTCPDESDFPKYYNSFDDADGIKYDLEGIYDPNDGLGKNPIPAFAEGRNRFPQFTGFRSDGPPQVCSVAFLGLANSLP